MKKVLLLVAAGAVVLGLTACGQTDAEKLEQLLKDAQYSQTCIDNGGHVWTDRYGDPRCDFEKEED